MIFLMQAVHGNIQRCILPVIPLCSYSIYFSLKALFGPGKGQGHPEI